MFNLLKRKPKLYWFRIYYCFKVETNVEVCGHPSSIRTLAPDLSKAMEWFLRDNPHVHVKLITEEAAL